MPPLNWDIWTSCEVHFSSLEKDFCHLAPCMAHLLKVKLTYTKTFLNIKANCGHDYKAKTIKKQTYAKHRSVPRYLNTT